MKDTVELIATAFLVIIMLSCIAYMFSNISIHVIQPEEGIKCVVVSRMFNTSVDCWKEDIK